MIQHLKSLLNSPKVRIYNEKNQLVEKQNMASKSDLSANMQKKDLKKEKL